MDSFKRNDLKRLYRTSDNSSNEDNGQVTIIGGSKLFHGAPILSLKIASRIVDMVFFASPEPGIGAVAEKVKSKLMSFVWVPWEDVEAYIKKSDSVLIGPGFMRFGSEKTPESERDNKRHSEGRKTREITKDLLKKFPNKKWVIDAGSLQVMETSWIPRGAILTPNKKEFSLLFGEYSDRMPANTEDTALSAEVTEDIIRSLSEKCKCTIVLKGPETIVCSSDKCSLVKGGNAGLTKGGTGDVLAGLTAALFAKNSAHLSACAASYIEKKAADELFEKIGTNYNADDLADKIPKTLNYLLKALPNSK